MPRTSCFRTSLITLAIATTGCLISAGCEKEPIAGPSKPAPRTPNKTPTGDGEMTPEQRAAAPTLPERPQTNSVPIPAPGPGEVRMGGASASTATPPSNSPPAAPPDSAAATPAAQSADATVASFAGLSGPKPAAWQYRAPPATSTMRVAEYSVPGVEGSDQAQIVVYQFPGGGTPETNVERWKTQFRNADGSDVVAKTDAFEADGMSVTVAEIAGEYRGMGKSEYAADQILLAAMVQTDGDPVFVQLVGPSKTVQANRDAFMTLMREMKKTEPMK